MFGKATSLTAIALGAFAVGCEDPEATTDLRPEGGPEVLSVLVMNDADSLFIETATFCKTNDAKRPAFNGTIGGDVCDPDISQPAGFRDPDTGDFVPAGVEDAVPTDWYIRVMFDELLDPDIEELIPILDPVTMVETGLFTGSLLNTQPVILTCGGNVVAYDGYYSPSGNAVTWPVGPSLFVKPIDHSTIATSSECTVELKDSVVDKEGEPVPGDQRALADYKWSVSALAFLGSAPAPAGNPGEEEIITPDAPVVLTFNAFIDAATLAAAEVTVVEVPVDAVTGVADCANAGTAKTAVVAADPADPLSLNISIAGVNQTNCTGCVFDAEKAYVVTFSDTNEVADVAGGTGALPGAADFTLCFTTDVAP